MTAPVLNFRIDNLSCAGCAGRAERALRSVDGVEDASVNLATHSAQVHGTASMDDLRAALAAAGYPAHEEHLRLSVEGMSCASCVGRVEASLHSVRGVTQANVNLATESADIRFTSGLTDVEALIDAVRDAGYNARRTEDVDSTAKPEDTLRRDFAIASVLTLPVFLTEMGGHLVPSLHHAITAMIGQTAFWTIQFILITLVLAWPGQRFYRIGLPLLAKGAPDMNSLVALGTLAAWGYSTIALFFGGLLPESARAVYFEAAGVIVTLILLGRWLESRAKGRTGDAIRRLMNLRPDTARVERDGEVVERPAEELRKGDVVHLRPGERVAVDGIVLTGRSFVDESMISGEPVPVDKSEGAKLVGGTINGQGALTFRVTAIGADTVLARIIRLVEDAQGAKLPIQALVDTVVRYFVPVVLAIAVLSVLVWLVFGPGLTFALVAGVSVLIVACPCAMGLATPTSIMVGTGRAAELGVLFRKGDALQRLDDVRVVAFDKTGTLTEGRPELVRNQAFGGFDGDDVLALAASVEAGSEHPIARALERAATEPRPDVTDIEAIPGYGLQARAGTQTVLIGAERLMAREGIALDAASTLLDEIGAKGQTPVVVAIGGQLAGVFAVADRVKPEAAQAIRALHDAGVKTAMITGDTAATANAIAQELGIDAVEAGVLPDGKQQIVTDLRDRFGPVAFVGDGINDAPALAASDVGIAIGTGTDVAIDSADAVLVSGDVQGVVRARAISAATMRNIRQNLFWAFGYNTALIPVAAGVLYPAFGILLSPMLAAGAMALSSVFVVSNALRLRRAVPQETVRTGTPEMKEQAA